VSEAERTTPGALVAGAGRAGSPEREALPAASLPYRPVAFEGAPAPPTVVEELRSPGLAAGEDSTFRFHVGPAVLLEPAGPGLFTALDIGRGAVGGRASASWLRAESARGLAVYAVELWVDLRHRYAIPPIVGAGASLLRGGALGDASSVGAGVLRAGLEYELPVDDADARLALHLIAHVPAMGTDRTAPWASAALTIGAGF
jgi:hypothetical protein